MSNTIGTILITFQVNNERKEYLVEKEGAALTIDDTFMMSVMKDIDVTDYKNISSCTIRLAAQNCAINISDYTLTEIIAIHGFFDKPSKISIFKSTNTNIHMTDQTIDIMQADCESVLLGDCIVKKMELGMNWNFDTLKGQNDTETEFDISTLAINKVDIRNCMIKEQEIFCGINRLNIQRSKIDKLSLIGNFGFKETSIIDDLYIWQNSNIELLDIRCRVNSLKVEDSDINTVTAKAKCHIGELLLINSQIFCAYAFKERHFVKKSTDAWILIAKSAENAREYNIRAEANYIIARDVFKEERGISRIANFLFDKISGYGYKPFRVLLASVVLVLGFMVVYTVLDLFAGGNLSESLCRNIVNSMASLAGKSDFILIDGAKFWLSILEYIFGVILFAVFANALYVRYKD